MPRIEVSLKRILVPVAAIDWLDVLVESGQDDMWKIHTMLCGRASMFEERGSGASRHRSDLRLGIENLGVIETSAKN